MSHTLKQMVPKLVWSDNGCTSTLRVTDECYGNVYSLSVLALSRARCIAMYQCMFLKLASQVVLWDEDETDGVKFDSP